MDRRGGTHPISLALLDVAYPTAFAAGVVSFLSPCILPLVPAYLSFLAGVSFADAEAAAVGGAASRRIVAAGATFVAGFSAVFIALGASASLLGRALLPYADVLGRISGVVIVIFGLHLLGVIRLPFLSRDLRLHPKAGSGIGTAFVLGCAFAFGWTPCVGPVLAVILGLAASNASLGHGIALLACFALGLGVPFLIAAIAFGPFVKALKRMRGPLRILEPVVAVFLIVTGALFATGTMAATGGWLLRTFPALGNIG